MRVRFKMNYKIAMYILFALLVFKSCESCSRSNTIVWERTNHTHVVDSLNHVISVLHDDNKTLTDSIKLLNVHVRSINSEKQILIESNKNQMNTNKELIKTLNKNTK